MIMQHLRGRFTVCGVTMQHLRGLFTVCEMTMQHLQNFRKPYMMFWDCPDKTK